MLRWPQGTVSATTGSAGGFSASAGRGAALAVRGVAAGAAARAVRSAWRASRMARSPSILLIVDSRGRPYGQGATVPGGAAFPSVPGEHHTEGMRAPDALRTKMQLGETEMTSAIWDIGPFVNGRGDALTVGSRPAEDDASVLDGLHLVLR